MEPSSPFTPPVNSGISWTEPSSPFTPPSYSGTSWIAPSGFFSTSKAVISWTAASSPFTPPSNSGTSLIAISLPLVPPGIPVPSRFTGKLCILSIAPATISVISWPISSFLTANNRVFVSYWVKNGTKLPLANFKTGAWLTKTSESNSKAIMFLPISTAFFTFASVGEIISLLKKSQLNFL